MSQEKQLPRRDFIKKSAIIASVAAVPAYLSTGCSEQEQEKKDWPAGKLNIAIIGIGMGYSNMTKCMDENIIALCDVDKDRMKGRLESFTEEYPDKTVPYEYQDYKKMFTEIGDQIDAVVIATPDHTHANITLEAMKLGKHVYCQKPLTHTVYESRILTQAAEKYNVATQMGNQGSSGDDTAWVCESIWNGDIGEIKEVHAWTNRPLWPQCLNRPEDTPRKPSGLNWVLWLGPAPQRPYSPQYHPWSWRGWSDFGTGALGDMACHILDVVMRSLRLEYPTGIEASSSKWTVESPPEAEKISYYFPKREPYKNVEMPEVKVTWYDGGLMPDRPIELRDGERMGDNDGGVLFVGTKGKIMTGCYAQNAKRLPSEEFADYAPEINERKVNGSIGGHEKDWIRACKEDPATRVKTKSHFGYAGPFNEVVVMGTVAARLSGLRRVLKWDGKNMKFTNIGADEKIRIPTIVELDKSRKVPRYNSEYEIKNALDFAQNLINPGPRKGWELKL
jgi:predicted dehydrogenase